MSSRCTWHLSGKNPTFKDAKWFNPGCPDCEAAAQEDPIRRKAPTIKQLKDAMKQRNWKKTVELVDRTSSVMAGKRRQILENPAPRK